MTDITDLCSAWADVEDACCDVAESSPTVYADMLDVASYILFLLTGSQWPGVCNEIVRPVSQGAAQYNAPIWHGAPLASGAAGNAAWGWWSSWCSSWTTGYEGGCGCGGVSSIQLGGFPIDTVNSVLVDGVQLDPSEYTILNRGWLLRLPNVGETTRRTWPCTSRVDLPFSAVDTFAVDYDYGSAPPSAGRAAAASLACDLTAACDPNDSCAIPERLSSMLRENAQYDFRVVDDPNSTNDDYTGNRLADLFIRTVNPGGVRAPAVVWSPDVRRNVNRLP